MSAIKWLLRGDPWWTLRQTEFFAVLEGQLLAGEIDCSAFLERASPIGIGVSEAAAVVDKVLAITSNQAARQWNLKSSYDYILVGSGAAGP